MARLSRKVVWWVFLSVLVIEAIILVPSLYNLDFASSQFAFWNSKIVEKRQKTNKTYEK
jgi:hypothetical protein